MFSAVEPQASPCYSRINSRNRLSRRPSDLNLAMLGFSSISLQTHDATSTSGPTPSRLTSAVGSPPSVHLSHWNLTHRHLLILNAMACAAAISTTWLFFSAIPSLLAFKKAAESVEKLLDATREELPDTMAAVRLSGTEISDLTMELSDLGQEITQGVKSSTRAVRLAEDDILRQLTNMTPIALVQDVANQETKRVKPVLARTARNLREEIVQGRTVLQVFFTLTRFSRLALNCFAARGQKKR